MKHRKRTLKNPVFDTTWTTSDGRVMEISQMEHQHILNAINYLESLGRQRQAGLALLCGLDHFVSRTLLSRDKYQYILNMDKAELAEFFFPKYKLLINELAVRNKNKIRDIIIKLENERELLRLKIEQIKSKEYFTDDNR